MPIVGFGFVWLMVGWIDLIANCLVCLILVTVGCLFVIDYGYLVCGLGVFGGALLCCFVNSVVGLLLMLWFVLSAF